MVGNLLSAVGVCWCRFEEGKVGDQWLASCSQLLEARWQQPTGLGYPHLGSQPPVLQRLTRVHNRFLRSR